MFSAKDCNSTVIKVVLNGQQVALKRIPAHVSDEQRKLEDVLCSLDHPNVNKILQVATEAPFRFYFLELCNSSLDKCFLPENQYQYRGPMPLKEDVLLQLARGLNYIHSRGLSHRNIKPENALIKLLDFQDYDGYRHRVQMKWGDCSLTAPLNRLGSDSIMEKVSKRTYIWMAPELLGTEIDFKNEADIYSQGLVFAYFLLGGVHPFGERLIILNNMLQNKPVKLEGMRSSPVKELIQRMLKYNSKERPSSAEVENQLEMMIISKKEIINTSDQVDSSSRCRTLSISDLKLGEGGYGCVFEGSLEDTPVAVKKISSRKLSRVEESDNLKRLDHPNVIKLLHVEYDPNKAVPKCFALELCRASLDKYFLEETDVNKYNGPMPADEDVLLQLAEGLAYIHAQNLIHRDLKPENALIWVGTDIFGNDLVLMKWADFGLSRPVSERGTFLTSSVKGTQNWLAPELLKQFDEGPNRNSDEKELIGSIKSDIFAAGLVFGYFTLGGKHIFGSEFFKIPVNIGKGNPVFLKEITPKPYRNLLADMLKKEPDERVITAFDAVKELDVMKYQGSFNTTNGHLNQQANNSPTEENPPALLQHRKSPQINATDKKLFSTCKGSKPNLRLIEDLLMKDSTYNVCCIDEEGMTPLFHLIRNRNFKGNDLVKIMNTFIERGMNVHYRTKSGYNIMHILCENHQLQGLTDAMQLLLEQGVDINCKDNTGKTALHVLCSSCGEKTLQSIARFLLDNQVDVECTDKDGWNALHYLCQYYNEDDLIDLIHFFVERGVKLNCATNDGETVLHILCRSYDGDDLAEIIRYLVDQKIELNRKSIKDESALYTFCEAHQTEDDLIKDVARIFLENGVTLVNSEKEKIISLFRNNREEESIRRITELVQQFNITDEENKVSNAENY